MPRGRPKSHPKLNDHERSELERLVRRQKTSQRLALRAKIVLASAEGGTDAEIAEKVGAHRETVGRWRRRFLAKRLDGLYDEPRPGAPRKITDDQVEAVVVETLESKPKGATTWSTRLLAEKSGLSQSSVSRIWRAFGLAPHKSETFCLSTDPFFVEKVRDVVGLYLDPPHRAIVLSFDEKSQIQALNRTQRILPLTPGQAERQTHGYERHGVTSLFAALDVATGWVFGKCYRKHRAKEFLKFLRALDAEIDDELEVHLIMDNLSTHKTAAVERWFARHPRFTVHFTPTYSSWLNQVERWFALLTQRQLKRGSHTSVRQLEEAIHEFLEAHNENPKPFVWTKSADQILDSVARFCRRTIARSGS